MRDLALAAAFVAVVSAPRVAHAIVVTVTNGAELRTAVEGASPGDVITLSAGTYDVTGNLLADTTGTAAAPIVVRAAALGDALIRFDAVEGFHVTAPYWTFENLDIEGVCPVDDDCEHAFHITGDAEHTTVRGCRLHEYNAMIKGNGSPIGPGGAYVWPDDVVIEYTEFFSAAPRNTGNPVTPIDVVGGRRWVLRGNFIHDHAKGGGDNISYAAFLKGNSRDGLIERNLVWCEMLHTGLVRLGLSFGGGGSGPDMICEDSTCSPEHQDGVMRNNIIVHCPADVGIYVNEGMNVEIYNNTLYDTTGIDLRFAATVADVRNNLLEGTIRLRDCPGDCATATLSSNLQMLSAGDFAAWFTAPDASDFTLLDGATFVDLGETLAAVPDDFCTNTRDDGMNDIGAVEYDGDGPCDTTRPFTMGGVGPGTDAGVPGSDGGGGGGTDALASTDGGTAGTDAGGGGGGGGCRCSVGVSGAAGRPVVGGAVAVLVVLAIGLLRRTARGLATRGRDRGFRRSR